jgi:amino acid permease
MIFLVFGSVGYLAFGESTEHMITLNLPEDWSTTSVQIALSLALFFTFPIMMVPVYEVIERSLESAPWFSRSVAPGRRWGSICVCVLHAHTCGCMHAVLLCCRHTQGPYTGSCDVHRVHRSIT